MEEKIDSPAAVLQKPEAWAGKDMPFLPWGEGRELLSRYMGLLFKWNKALNLTGCHSALNFMRDLCQDSFHLATLLESLDLPGDALVADLGAGAGLPGIPLRIFWPKANYVMVERSEKRCSFLQNVLGILEIGNTKVCNGDARKFLQDSSPAAILSRAFLPPPKLLELCSDRLNPNGILILMVNELPQWEMQGGWRIRQKLRYDIPRKSRYLIALSRS